MLMVPPAALCSGPHPGEEEAASAPTDPSAYPLPFWIYLVGQTVLVGGRMMRKIVEAVPG